MDKAVRSMVSCRLASALYLNNTHTHARTHAYTYRETCTRTHTHVYADIIREEERLQQPLAPHALE